MTVSKEARQAAREIAHTVPDVLLNGLVVEQIIQSAIDERTKELTNILRDVRALRQAVIDVGGCKGPLDQQWIESSLALEANTC